MITDGDLHLAKQCFWTVDAFIPPFIPLAVVLLKVVFARTGAVAMGVAALVSGSADRLAHAHCSASAMAKLAQPFTGPAVAPMVEVHAHNTICWSLSRDRAL